MTILFLHPLFFLGANWLTFRLVFPSLQRRCSDPQTHTRTQSLAQADTIDVQTRNRELTEIANSIASLAELFKDLSVLVIDQGTILDSVEYNIEQTAVHVSEAVKELKVATQCVIVS